MQLTVSESDPKKPFLTLTLTPSLEIILLEAQLLYFLQDSLSVRSYLSLDYRK